MPLNPYVLAALAAAFALLAAWGGWGEYRVQALKTDLVTLERDAAQDLATARKEIQLLQDAAVAKERKTAADLAELSNKYAQEKRDAQAAADRLVADLRAGTVRLRNRLAARSCPSVPASTAAGGGSDAAGAVGLSPADAEFLVRESERADTVTRRLALCQSTVRSYLLLVNGADP